MDQARHSPANGATLAVGREDLPIGLSSVEAALDAVAAGEMVVVVVDGPDGPSEGSLVMAAGLATPDALNFMARHGRGQIHVALTRERLSELQITPMVPDAGDVLGEAAYVSVDARDRAGRRGSPDDRAFTIRALADPGRDGSHFRRPGHVFPLAVQPGGALARPAPAEAAVDLARLAGLVPGGVTCDIARPEGEMDTVADLVGFADHHGLPVLAVDDLISFRRCAEERITRLGAEVLELGAGTFAATAYGDGAGGPQHLVVTMGELDEGQTPLVRVQWECVPGDVFGSGRCDCAAQLEGALERIADAGQGAVVYVRTPHVLAGPDAGREYRVPAQILADQGVSRVRLLCDDPAVQLGLEGYGVTVVERVPLVRPEPAAIRPFLLSAW